MRTLWMITTALLTVSATPVLAQSAPQTLDAQLEQIRGTNQAAPHAAAPARTTYQSMIDSQGSGAIPALPLNVMTNGSVTYVSGGISDEELDMLKARSSEFNLHIMINATGGAFMVPSKFHVLDSAGLEVLRIDDAGPYVYVKLTPGKYTIEAVEEGEIKTATVNVPASGAAKVQMTFKQ